MDNYGTLPMAGRTCGTTAWCMYCPSDTNLGGNELPYERICKIKITISKFRPEIACSYDVPEPLQESFFLLLKSKHVGINTRYH